MSARIFNICVLLGWCMAVAGGCLWNLSAGLVGGGLLMLVIVFAAARIGGVYAPTKSDG